MANIKDISTTIESALIEVGVHGTLDVKMDGDEATIPVGHPTGDDVKVVVTVKPAAAA